MSASKRSANKTLVGNWYEERAWEGTRRNETAAGGGGGEEEGVRRVRRGRAPANYPGALTHTAKSTGAFHAGADGLSLPHSADAGLVTVSRIAYAPPPLHTTAVKTTGARRSARHAALWAQAEAEVKAAKDAEAAAAARAEWETTYGSEVASLVPEPVDIDVAVLGGELDDAAALGTVGDLVSDVPITVWRQKALRAEVGTASTGPNVFGRNAGFSQPVHEYTRAFTKFEEEADPYARATNRRTAELTGTRGTGWGASLGAANSR